MVARAELGAEAGDPRSRPACDVMTSRPLLSLLLLTSTFQSGAKSKETTEETQERPLHRENSQSKQEPPRQESGNLGKRRALCQEAGCTGRRLGPASGPGEWVWRRPARGSRCGGDQARGSWCGGDALVQAPVLRSIFLGPLQSTSPTRPPVASTSCDVEQLLE